MQNNVGISFFLLFEPFQVEITFFGDLEYQLVDRHKRKGFCITKFFGTEEDTLITVDGVVIRNTDGSCVALNIKDLIFSALCRIFYIINTHIHHDSNWDII